MTYKISLTYGDPSADGHGMSRTSYFLSNYPASAIEQSVIDVGLTNGFDFSTFCQEYEDCTLPTDTIDTLQSAGVSNIVRYIDIEDGEDYHYVEDFTGLYLAIASVGLPDLQVTPTHLDYDAIYIGGYGMLSNG